MNIVIHHNPNCGTSRATLAHIIAEGHHPTVIDYLTEGWTRPQLLALFAAAGLTPRTALRVSEWEESAFGALNSVEDDIILNLMLTHPILVQRPIVCCVNGTRLCRPSALVLELLDAK